MNRAIKILTGAAAGIAAAYFLDPKKGAERRAMVKDKFNSFKNDPQGTISGLKESFREKAEGFANEAKGMIGDGTSGADTGRERDVANRPYQTTQTTH